MKTHGIMPLFKGDVPPISGKYAEQHRRDNEAVITGLNPDNGQRIESAAYLQTLKRVKGIQRQIPENVARIFAASLLAHDAVEREHQARLFLLEGCKWDWGTAEPRMGCEIEKTIYGAVPESMRRGIPEPFVKAETRRTRDEFASLFYYEKTEPADCDELTAVTHPYHAFRAGQIGAFMSRQRGNTKSLDVITPSDIVSVWSRFHTKPQPDQQFVLDAIKIGEPTIVTNMFHEGPKESALLCLHGVERFTGRDVEGEILEKMAVRNAK